MGLGIPPLKRKITLESNPLESRIFVRRLAVCELRHSCPCLCPKPVCRTCLNSKWVQHEVCRTHIPIIISIIYRYVHIIHRYVHVCIYIYIHTHTYIIQHDNIYIYMLNIIGRGMGMNITAHSWRPSGPPGAML